MATETERLSDLKCRDCLKCHPFGLLARCMRTHVPIDPNGPACISIEKRETKNGNL